MNDLARIAQNSFQPVAVTRLTLTRPANGAAQVIPVTSGMVLDLRDIAAQDIVVVHAGDRLIILFADRSTIVLSGFYGQDGHPIAGLEVDIGRGLPMPATDIASLLPISDDQSILPAAGPAAPAAPPSALHTSQVAPDVLDNGLSPLDLLGPGDFGGNASGLSDQRTSNGPNNPASIGGRVSGTVIEDVVITVAGVLTISDPDGGEALVVAQTRTAGGYGAFSIDATGAWSYVLNNDDPRVQALGVGKTLTETFTVASFDDSAHQTITVTINGTNDVPVLGGTITGDVTEDGALTGDGPITKGGSLTATGTLTIADVDTGESSFVAQADVVTAHGTFSVDAAGHWSYVLNNGDPAVQALGAGKSLTENFVVTSFDGTATETVTVTINGTNDIPVLAGTVTGQVKEDGTLVATGALTIADVDSGESSFAAQSATAGQHGTFSVDAAGQWAYTLTNGDPAVQALGAGKTLTENFVVTSFDGTATETVTVTINGTNDVPVLGGTVTGQVKEDGTLVAIGALTIADVDTVESSFVAQSGTAGQHGSFSVDAAGNWTYTLTNGDPAVQALGAGKSLTENFVVTSFDGTATETVTVTINGTNDVPVLGGTVARQVKEDGTLVATGALTIADVDTGESSFVAQSGTAGQHGSFSVDAAGNWTYTLTNGDPAVQALGAGKTLTENFVVRSFDGTASETVTVTINGTNDVPVIGGAATGSVKEETVLSATGTLTIADIDTGESKFIAQTSTAGTYGSFSVTAAGAWTYTLANSSTAVQALGAGAHPTETFTVVSADGTAQQTVIITVNGTNDVPTLFGVTSGSVTEDSVLTAGSTVNITDKDTGEAFYTAQTGTAGTYGTFTIDTTGHWTYTLNNSSTAVQALGAGVNPTETFKVWSADQSASLNITVTVKGANDAPVAQNASFSVSEDGTLTNRSVTATDIDSASLSYALVGTAPAGLTFSTSTGVWSYSPAALQGLDDGEQQQVTFQYKASDGTAVSNTATVTITVTGANDAPVAQNGSISVTEDLTLTGKTVTVTDVDVETLTYTLVGAAPTGLTFNSDGTWSYATPASYQSLAVGQSANVTFQFKANDGTADSNVATETITITGVNDLPVAKADSGTMTENTGTQLFNVLANDTLDIDSGALNNITVGTITVFGGSSYGIDASDLSVTATSSGLQVTLLGTDWDRLTNGASLPITIGYTLHGDQSSDLATNQLTLTVTGANDAPVLDASKSPTITVNEDAGVPSGAVGVSVSSLVGFAGAGGIGNVSDPDSTLTGIAVTGLNSSNGTWYWSVNGSAWSVITVNSLTDAHALVLDASYSLYFKPNANFNGTITDGITFRAWDHSGGTPGAYADTSVNNGGTTPYSPATDTVSVTVSAVNDAPVAPNASASVSEDGTLTGQHVTATDADSDPLTYAVSGTAPSGLVFNTDGTWSYTPPAAFQGLDSGESQQVTFQYKANDGTADSNAGTVTITVTGANDAPVAQNASVSVSEDSTLTGQSAVATDVDLETLTYAVVGSAPSGLTFNSNGTWSYVPPASFQALDNGEQQQVTFQYKANDGTADSAAATVTITVNGANDAPVAPNASVSVSEDSTLTGQAVVATDVDGEMLTYAVVGTPPAGLTFNGDGTWSYAPPASFQGLDTGESQQVTFQYKANDGTVDSAAATVTITINGANDAPAAPNGSASVSEDGTLTGQAVVATDVDGETLTYAVVGTAPSGLTFNADGTWSYVPPASFQSLNNGESAQVSFQYKANDGTVDSAAATVTITVNGANDAPVAQDASVSVSEDGTLTGQSVTATEPGATLSYAVVGTAPSGLAFNADGTWSYAPPAAFQSLDSGEQQQVIFQYKANDGAADSNIATVTITVTGANDAPAAPNASASVSEDGTLTGQSVTATDVDGETLTYAVVGTAPAGLTFNANGTWSYAPPASFQALDSGEQQQVTFQYKANDGTADSSPATVTITIDGANDAPVAPNGSASVSEDGTLTGKTVTATDVDGETLTYTLVGGAVSGLSFNSDGTWSYAPSASYQSLAVGQNAQVTFQYKANDGTVDSGTATETITITGANDAPIARPDSGSMTEGQGTTSFNVLGNDTLDIDSGALNNITVGAINVYFGTAYGLDASDLSVTASGSELQVSLLGTDWDRLAAFAGVTITVNYTLHGDQPSDFATNQLTLTVTGINDAPVLDATKTPGMSVGANAGAPVGAVGTLVSSLADTVGGGGLDNIADPDNTIFGIAVTGVNSAAGTWYYSANNGSNWTAISAASVSAGHALLLNSDYLVYFQPAANSSGTVADALTFRAWDHSSGTQGSYADTVASNGGSTAYSTATDTISVTVVNQPAVISGATTGAVIEAGGVANSTAGTPTATGDLNSTDADNPADSWQAVTTAAASTGGYGTYTIDAAGHWSYALANGNATVDGLAAGATLNDTFTVKTIDGTAQAVTVTITGANDAAVITGATTGAVTEDGTLTATGALTIADADSGQSSFVAQTATAGTYGSFAVTAAGAWTYTLNNAGAAVQALTPTSHPTETFAVVSADGTTTNVVITVNGVNDAPVLASTAGGSFALNEDPGPFGAAVLVSSDVHFGGTNSFSVSDVDSSVVGMAVTHADTSHGVWFWSSNNGATWTPMDASNISDSNALLLLSNYIFAFQPDANYNGTIANALSWRAWDESTGSAGGYADTSINGGTTAFSSGVEPLTVFVLPVNDVPVLGGATTGAVTEDGTLTATGALTISDADTGQSSFAAQTNVAGSHGSFSVTAAGAWTYTLDNADTAVQALNNGETRTDSFSVMSADGSASETVIVTITGANDAAVITGATTGAVIEAGGVGNTSRGTPSATGTLTDTDADDAPNSFQAVTTATASSGGYGSYTIDATGHWSYTLDNSNPAVEALGAGATLSDSFTARTADGTAQVITVTITGAADIPGVTLADIARDIGGFKIIGEAAGDNAGHSASSAGDVNGDGYDDLIVGGHLNDAGGSDAGAAYVIFGQATPLTTVDLAHLAPGEGFKIVGETAGDHAGYSVAVAGDVNHDGFADLIIGASNSGVSGTFSGAAYVVYGSASPAATIDLDAIAAGVGGFKISGQSAFDGAGVSVAAAGDVNGDGYDDVLVGASGASAAYVVYGGALPTSPVNLNNVASAQGGFKITGLGAASGDNLGDSVASVGDVNGDGFDDLLVGGRHLQDNGSGEAYLIYGHGGVQGNISLTDVAAGIGGFRIQGQAAGDNAGISASGLGDFNGDGYADLVVGAYLNDVGGNNAGAAYVVLGHAGTQGSFNLTNIHTVGGFRIVGETTSDGAGISVAGAGDVNGDGYDDLIVGAWNNDAGATNNGAAYVVYGHAGAQADINLDNVALGIGGFKIVGENGGDQAGSSVAAAGDLNHDGYDDLIVGAAKNDAGGSDAGAGYVIYGGSGLPNNTAAHIAGTDTGAVKEDVTSSISGVLTVTEPNLSAGTFAPETLTGTYGSFALLANGTWTYTLNNSNTSVQALNDGDHLTESFKVTSADGTAFDTVSVTIHGTTDGITSINLDNVALGVGGFKVVGENAGDVAGQGVGSAGDVNGDGYDDVIVGGDRNDAGGTDAGAAYVIYGGPNAALVNGVVDLDTVATGTGGFKIIGQSAGQHAASHVSSAGDVNNDGRADMLVVSLRADAAYVVYGGSNAALTNGVIDLDLVATGQGGFKILGEASGDMSSGGLAPAGDVNGDGYDDFILGAAGNAAGGAKAGAAYVIYGGPNSAPVGGVLDLHSIAAGTGGFKIFGENAYDLAGSGVGSAGDINQDGYDDLIIGAYGNGAGGALGGAAYVVYGGANAALVDGAINLDTIATGVGGFKIVAQGADDAVGISVATSGDVNGDGINDLVVGATGDDTRGASAGAAYVVYGGSNPALTGGTLDLATVATGAGGFKIIAEAAADNVGFGVSSAGDVNGDGYADVLISAIVNDAGGSDAGAAYVIYGGVNGAVVNGVVDLAVVASGNGGFKLIGEAADDRAGTSVSSAGDVNGDGYDDIIIGAPLNDQGGNIAGAAYVLYGSSDLGGQSGLTLTGTSANDTLTGKAGNDILTGGAGADILTGGLGADIFHYTALSQGGDTIKDFTKGEDLVGLLNSILGETGTGTLNFDGSFGGSSTVLFEQVAGATTAAQHNSAKLIFDTTGHDLYHDADGGASSSGRTLIAHFEHISTLEATNITLMAG